MKRDEERTVKFVSSYMHIYIYIYIFFTYASRMREFTRMLRKCFFFFKNNALPLNPYQLKLYVFSGEPLILTRYDYLLIQ